MTTKAKKHMNDDINDAAPTTHLVSNVARTAIDNTAEKAENIERQLREKAALAGVKVEASQEAASEQIERSINQVKNFAQERPVATAGIAFAAGILATTLLRK